MAGASVFGLPHLSEDAVAAFADGVLSASATARARRHCAECAECAQAVRAQREAALLLRAASCPSASADLLSRLASVPMSAPLPPRSGPPTVLGADGMPMFRAYDPRNADSDGPIRRPQPGPYGGSPDQPGRYGVSPDQPGEYPASPDQPGPRDGRSEPQHSHRRMLLPVGILASAAAVVAAGAIGTQLSSLPQPAEQQPASVQQLSTNLSDQRSAAPTGGRLGSGRSSQPVSTAQFGSTGKLGNTGKLGSTGQLGLGQHSGASDRLSRASLTPSQSPLQPVSSALPTQPVARPGG